MALAWGEQGDRAVLSAATATDYRRRHNIPADTEVVVEGTYGAELAGARIIAGELSEERVIFLPAVQLNQEIR